MTRPSKRTHILDAVLRVVDREGVAAVTFDSVAAEAGVTKGGMLYHFASKDALLGALHEHLAERLHEQLVECAGGVQPEALTAIERLVAYTRASAERATATELRLMFEAISSPELFRAWERVMRRWLPDASAMQPNDDVTLRLLLAQSTADGLWMASAFLPSEIDESTRRLLVERAIAELRRIPAHETDQQSGASRP